MTLWTSTRKGLGLHSWLRVLGPGRSPATPMTHEPPPTPVLTLRVRRPITRCGLCSRVHPYFMLWIPAREAQGHADPSGHVHAPRPATAADHRCPQATQLYHIPRVGLHCYFGICPTARLEQPAGPGCLLCRRTGGHCAPGQQCLMARLGPGWGLPPCHSKNSKVAGVQVALLATRWDSPLHTTPFSSTRGSEARWQGM